MTSTAQANCPFALRPDIAHPPQFMRDLPVDKRGYPVPWFVDWINGVPEFRAMDRRKFLKAINESRCWTCGKPLYSEKVFVIGPMCAVNRISSEPPSHRECAHYAAVNCPFLSKPQMVRRTDEEFNAARKPSAGLMVERNPGVTLLWYSRHHRLMETQGNRATGVGPGVIFQLGRPFKVEWYRQGRAATRAEVLESIESGVHLLRETAEKHDGPEGVLILEHQIVKALRLVPK